MQSLFIMGQVTIEIPYIFCQATVYSTIVYAMIGFEWTVEKFFWYLFFTTFAMLYFTFYGMMIVAATPNLDIATTVSSAFYGLWNLFSGFIVPCTVGIVSLLPYFINVDFLFFFFCINVTNFLGK